MEPAVRLSDSQAAAFAREYLSTGDPSLAYRSAKPGARKSSADRRGPQALRLPVVVDALARMRSEAAESVTDDSVLAECRRLVADASLSPRERLQAMNTYDKLRRGIGADANRADTGEWAPELRAFLRDNGVDVV